MEEKENGTKADKKTEKQDKAVNVLTAADEVDVFGDEDADAARIPTEKNFKTRYNIQSRDYVAGNGTIHKNYAIGFKIRIGDRELQNALRIRPKRKGGAAMEAMMEAIMSTPGEHKLEIKRTSMRVDGVTNVIYSMFASTLTDEGILYSCPLEPVGESDKAILENFKRQLIARGELE